MATIHPLYGALLLLFVALQTQAQTTVQNSKQVSIDSITQKNQSTPTATVAIWEYQDKFWETNEVNQQDNMLQDSTLRVYTKINGVDKKDIKMILPQEVGDNAQNVQIQVVSNGKYWKTKQD